MEKLMQYVWQHRLWESQGLTTVDGKRIRVIDPGVLNTDAGPDFFNAKIEIDREMSKSMCVHPTGSATTTIPTLPMTA